ncbi:GNAT family N-acetyltransferase, partial [Saccharopolyspora kobensis]|uniref:GNAT family N-acetyltransferase n=1 Tax=Saccharopolyspora kobensis TaxID=146035 RepID=UPI00331C8E4B
MGELFTRSLRAGEAEAFFDVFSAAFLNDSLKSAHEAYGPAFRMEHAHGVFDGDEVIGGAARLEQEITVPGPALPGRCGGRRTGQPAAR